MRSLFDKEFTLDRTIRLGIIALIVWGMILLIDRLSGVLLPFVVALVLAYLLDPVVSFIQKRVRNNRSVAVFITFFLILLANVAFYAILIPSMINQVESFQEVYEANKDGLFSGDFIPEKLRNNLQEFFHSEEFHSMISLESIGPMIQKSLPGVWGYVTNIFGILGSIIGLITILLYLIFLLMDYASFRDNWTNYVPEKVRDQVVEFTDEMNKSFFGYFRQKTIIVIINIVLFAIGFGIMGLPLALPLAILIGTLNYIPYLQNLGLIPAFLAAGLWSLETGHPFWLGAVIVLGIFILLQLLEDAVLVPKLMREVTGLNPALMLLSLAIWGSLLGILGLIIALPFTGVMVTYYKKYILTN